MKNKIKNTQKTYSNDPYLGLIEGMLSGPAKMIEDMEARGQTQLAKSDQLPADGGYKGSPLTTMAALGIDVIGPTDGDPLFMDVRLPDGWKITPTDHSMWCDLVDDKGRKRAGIFYKAAFYDRAAHISFNCRFTIEPKYPEDYRNPDSIVNAKVTDWDDTTLYTSDDFKYREGARTHPNGIDVVVKQCELWLHQNYSDYEDPTAYWD